MEKVSHDLLHSHQLIRLIMYLFDQLCLFAVKLFLQFIYKNIQVIIFQFKTFSFRILFCIVACAQLRLMHTHAQPAHNIKFYRHLLS